LQRVAPTGAATIALAASPSSIKAAIGKTSTLTATVKKADGTGLSGDQVLFTSSGAACGTIDTISGTPAGTTDANGVVTAVYHATTTVGTCTVTVQEANAGLSTSTTVTQTVAGNSVAETFNGACVAGSGANTPGACIKSDGASTVKATAKVTSPSGNPVVGDVVTFTAAANTSGVCSSSSLSASTATTDTNGNASVTYTASTTTGYCTVTATEGATSGSDSESIDQTLNIGTLPANAVTVQAGVALTTLSAALVTTAPTAALSVAALPSAVTAGTQLQLKSGTHSQSPIIVAAPAAAGATSITVTPFTANFAYPIGTSVLTLAGSVPADGSTTATVTITVSDSTGVAVSGDPVMLSTSGSPSAACGGLSGTGFGSTDANGVVTVTYTASTTAGTCTITAQEANGAHNGSGTITQTASNNVAVTANPASLKADGTSTSAITVTVTDSSGAAVSGDAISFTVGAAGANACGALTNISGSPSGNTDSTGKVTATYTSSTTIGFCKIKATDSTGASGSVTIIQTS
jgi:adhesin/invasin